MQTFLLGFLALSAALAKSPNPYEGGDRYAEPRPYKSTALARVDVVRNGLWTGSISGDETPQSCADFVLRTADVREFFGRARRASFKEYGHDLEMSRCHAMGRLRFANGDHGRWWIDRERRGRITLSDGRNLYFHCADCTAAAFDEP